MARLVSLLLVPFFVLGQALPHSHAGTGMFEPDGHSIRAHIHVAGGHHHDHDGDEHHHVDQSDATGSRTARSTAFSAATDHDSDAFYLAETNWTASRTVATPQIDSAVLVWTSFVPSVERAAHEGSRFGNPPDRYAGLPIYLLTASLRL
jgi:hypothetical protein